METKEGSTHYLLRVRNAKQLVAICANGERFKAGPDQDVVMLLPSSSLHCDHNEALSLQIHIIDEGTVVVNNKGLIEAVGPEKDLNQRFANATFDVDIDATGKVVLPGNTSRIDLRCLISLRNFQD